MRAVALAAANNDEREDTHTWVLAPALALVEGGAVVAMEVPHSNPDHSCSHNWVHSQVHGSYHNMGNLKKNKRKH
jgi:hypothetical protein